MKPLNKKKQNLGTAGEIMMSCVCRTHACGCGVVIYGLMVDLREDLYNASYTMAVRGVEPTSVNSK